jgi:hypothetical protein
MSPPGMFKCGGLNISIIWDCLASHGLTRMPSYHCCKVIHCRYSVRVVNDITAPFELGISIRGSDAEARKRKDKMEMDTKDFDYARAGPLVCGLFYRVEDGASFTEYYAFGKPDWLPVGLLLMHYNHAFLKDMLASMMGSHNLPPEDWFVALKRQGGQLLNNRGRSSSELPTRASDIGWALQDAGYFWLMCDAVSRAVPLHNGIVLEASRRFAENIGREEFIAVRRACAGYLETVLTEATGLIGQQGVAVEEKLIHLPGYMPYCCEIDATP